MFSTKPDKKMHKKHNKTTLFKLTTLTTCFILLTMFSINLIEIAVYYGNVILWGMFGLQFELNKKTIKRTPLWKQLELIL